MASPERHKHVVCRFERCYLAPDAKGVCSCCINAHEQRKRIAVLPGVPSHAERSFWLVLWLGDYYDLARLASCCMALRPSSHVWCWSCNETQPCTWRFLRYRGIPMRIEELVHHAWNDCCHRCAMARRHDDDAKPFVYAGRYSEYDGARRLARRARAAEVGWGYSSPELSD